MNKKNVMVQALEALNESVDLVHADYAIAFENYGKLPTRQAQLKGLQLLVEKHEAAILALQAAIAQPEQPATERNFCERCGKRLSDSEYIHTCTPPADQFADAGKAIQPLTDEQIERIYEQYDPGRAQGAYDFARAIEAAIKAEKD